MRFRCWPVVSVPLFALLCLCPAGSSARADFILGFPNGLAGWSTSGDAGTVTASNGQATIAESTFASETDLFRTFLVPTGAQSLQFTLVSVSPDSAPASGVTPDAFGASLLDPNTIPPISLVPTVDPTTDSFYTRDVVDGVTQGQAARGVTVSPPSGTPAVVSVDISSLAAGQAAEILFRLIGGGDPASSSTVTISDVKVVTGSTPAVPEPGAFLLASLGILGGLGYAHRLQRGRSPEAPGQARP